MANGLTFFDLPLELRNFVYRGLSRTLTTVPLPGQINQKHQRPELFWRAWVKSYTIPTLLTVSKDFKAEYEREICQRAELCLKYDEWQRIGIHPPGIKPILLPGCLLFSICHVQLDVVLRDWSDSVKPMLKEKYEILRVCTFPNIQTLEIHFTIAPDTMDESLENDLEAYDDLKELFVLVQKFSIACTQMYNRAAVDIDIYVKTKLFEPYVDHLYEDNLDRWNLREMLNQELNEIAGHETVWKASLAQLEDQYALWGLHLDFLSGGHFDAEEYDDLLDETVMMFEEAMEEDER